MKNKFGTSWEEQRALCLFSDLIKDISDPKILHISYDEELSSFIMWYALLKRMCIKFTKVNSYAE